MKERMKKTGKLLFFLLLTAGFLCLTIWCNTPYPNSLTDPMPYGRYSSAKVHLMTTDALVGTMLNTFGSSFTGYAIDKPNTLYHLLTGFEYEYDWTKEMLQRDDIGDVLFRFYQNAERPLDLSEKYPMVQEDFEIQDHADKLHILLAHPKVQSTMTEKQRNIFLKRIRETKEWYYSAPCYPYYPYDKNDEELLGEGGYESYWIDYEQYPDETFQKFYCIYDETGTTVTKYEDYPLGPLEREKGWKALYDRFYKQSSAYQYNSFEKRLLEDGYISEKDRKLREKTPLFYERMDDPYLTVKRRYTAIGEYNEVTGERIWDSFWQKDKRKNLPSHERAGKS